ncbi:hypothetical protein [Brevundimonas albigilva]|uniref:Uncharacterized protein n=1 Tax=Brevundimonas albigilva TaxID=1312364 RepID=A0ABY4SLW1_9CAUL|nr:hypothetical protein [Brevundimonas albigilva]URI15911.1 hypothetical protein M8231_02660 [Brevundimonas albigilva]
MHETVSAMIERGARIKWECEVKPIGHGGDADLHAIAKTKGGRFTLANRRAPCRIPGCPGRVRFVDMSSAWPRKLDTLTDKDDAWWAYFAAERKRLEALGWWMKGGYWQPPPAPVYGQEPESKEPRQPSSLDNHRHL